MTDSTLTKHPHAQRHRGETCAKCLYCASVQIGDRKPKWYCSYHNVRLKFSRICRAYTKPKGI